LIYPKKRNIDLVALTERMAAILDAQVARLDLEDKQSVFCFRHDMFGARISAGPATAVPVASEIIESAVPGKANPLNVFRPGAQHFSHLV